MRPRKSTRPPGDIDGVNWVSFEPARQANDVDAYLAALGERVRTIRARRAMTRKVLARDSGVSQRYIAQLEAGRGNMSIVLLRQLAQALDTPLEALVFEGSEPPIDVTRTLELLRSLSPEGQAEAHRLLVERFRGAEAANRLHRIALIGLRGAGKSTLGKLLAERMDASFVELDREVERESGLTLNEIFDLYGQPAFRRMERRSLERAIEQNGRIVIATGGGIVSDPATFDMLLANCYTVWVRAAPAEHMGRVMAQGDMRPMSNNREAMADLRGILRSREALYAKADAQILTTGRTIKQSLAELEAAVPSA